MKKRLLAAFVAAIMTFGPISAVFADTTAPNSTSTTVSGETYIQTTAQNPIQTPVVTPVPIDQVKAVLTTLLADPKNPDAKTEIHKLVSGKKDIPVIAKAIRQLKLEAVTEMKAARKAKDNAAFKSAQQKIHRLNALAKQLKQEIIAQAKEAKLAEQQAKKELAKLKEQQKQLNKALKLKKKAAQTQRKITELQTQLTKMQQKLAALLTKQATAAQAKAEADAAIAAQ